MEPDGFGTHLEAVGRFELLPPDEQRELGMLVVDGRAAEAENAAEDDPRLLRAAEAREKLVLHNLRWAIARAQKWSRTGVPMDDLVQAGSLGLMRAVEKWDPRRGTLTTYATHWIDQRVRRTLNEGFDGRERVPVHAFEHLSRYRELRGSVPRAQLAESLGLSESVLQGVEAADRLRRTDSINRPLGQGDASARLSDVLPGDHDAPESGAEVAEVVDRVRAAVDRLPPALAEDTRAWLEDPARHRLPVKAFAVLRHPGTGVSRELTKLLQ